MDWKRRSGGLVKFVEQLSRCRNISGVEGRTEQSRESPGILGISYTRTIAGHQCQVGGHHCFCLVCTLLPLAVKSGKVAGRIVVVQVEHHAAVIAGNGLVQINGFRLRIGCAFIKCLVSPTEESAALRAVASNSNQRFELGNRFQRLACLSQHQSALFPHDRDFLDPRRKPIDKCKSRGPLPRVAQQPRQVQGHAGNRACVFAIGVDQPLDFRGRPVGGSARTRLTSDWSIASLSATS